MYALTVVAVRLMGVAMILMFSVTIIGIFLALYQPGAHSGQSVMTGGALARIFAIAYALTPLLVGMALIASSKTVAAMILPRRTKEQRTFDVSVTDGGLMRAGTALMGIWVLAKSFEALVGLILFNVAVGQGPIFDARAIAPAVGLVVGLLLVVAGRRAVGFLTKTRIEPLVGAVPDADA